MTIQTRKYAREISDGQRPMTYARSPHLTVAAGLCVLAAVAWTYSQTNGSTTVAAAVLVAVFVALIRGYRASTNAVPQPTRSTLSDAENWFRRVCRDARVPVPLVLDDYPTQDGHEYEVLITGWCESEGRPMTVEAWFGFAALLKDTAGLGCRNVEPWPDKDHGGRGRIEFHGVRFEEWQPDDPTTELPDLPVDDVPQCAVRTCTSDAEFHAQLRDETHRSVGLCAAHLEGYGARLAWYHELDGDCVTGAGCGHYEDDRECSGGDEPLSPQVILHPEAEEGSSGWGPPAPGTAQPAPRPKGADEDTGGGRLWDLLTLEPRPFSRSTLASESGLTPGVVSRRLADWKALGLVEQVGQLWRASRQYTRSGTLTPNGREEDAGE